MMKKQQSNEPFCLEIWLATSAKGCLAGNEKKTKITERREVWEGCFSAPVCTHLHLHGDLCATLDSQDNCMLCHSFCRVAHQVFQAKKSCRFHMLLQLVEVKPVESTTNAG